MLLSSGITDEELKEAPEAAVQVGDTLVTLSPFLSMQFPFRLLRMLRSKKKGLNLARHQSGLLLE